MFHVKHFKISSVYILECFLCIYVYTSDILLSIKKDGITATFFYFIGHEYSYSLCYLIYRFLYYRAQIS